MILLECKDLCIGYNGKPIFNNINFAVNAGDYLCITGANGSGKSTLLKTMLGLIKPVKGKVEYSKDLSSGRIGYLPQQKDIQKNFPASVYEVVQSGMLNQCRLLPFYSKKQKSIIMNNMETLGITDLKNKCYKELSGGQQQRVLLARALCAASCADNSLLFLDEPVTGLDPVVTQEMYSTIQSLNAGGMTIIMISHDLDAADRYAGQIIRMDKTQGTFTWIR